MRLIERSHTLYTEVVVPYLQFAKSFWELSSSDAMGHTFGLRETVSMMVGGIVGGGIYLRA